MPRGGVVAIDSETPSLTDSFTIKCVTAAWEQHGRTESVLLDPLRRPDDHALIVELCIRARWLALHNSAFDIPGLAAAGVLTRDQIGSKIVDTLIYARSAWTDKYVPKSLEDLAPKILGMPMLKGGLALAIKAAGYRSSAEWFFRADIDVPFYRFNAMADTVVTLRLLGPLQAAAADRQLDHPFARHGCTTRVQADALVDVAQRANRVMLRRAAKGLAVDLDYLDGYRDTVDAEIARHSIVLEAQGIRPGNGQDLVQYLDRAGALPVGWPRTEKTQRLSATKELLEELHHPLADVHRAIAEANNTLGYLEAVVTRSSFTGRLHPQYAILGACATGRMSMAEPAMQQFSEGARPIIVEDFPGAGVTSTDWSSIEPALLAWAANDVGFIEPFERGADLYEPIQRSAALAMTKAGRTTAKVALLAAIYGRGNRNTATALGMSEDEALALKRRMFDAMPGSARLMGKFSQIADDHGIVPTIAGRILTISKFNGKVASYKAVNSFCQGSNADLLYSAILAIDAAGLGEEIMIPMHDEIVSTTAAGPAIEEIMRTPPEYFSRWTDRTPTIRCDRQDLHRAWAKC
jgi:DNA polymerase-1